MNQSVTTYLSIDNKEVPHFVSFTLCQQFYAHNSFKLVLNQDALLQGSHTMQSTLDYIGKFVVMSFGQKSPGDNAFRGLITDVSLQQEHGQWANLVLKGFSPTYLLEGGAHFASFSEHDLSVIVKKLCANLAADDLNLVVKPAFRKEITYVCQYKESNFQFLNRLAIEYCEWFYFDGQNLHFGRPNAGEAVRLVYGEHIQALDFSLRLVPSRVSHFNYNSEVDQVYTSQSDRVSGVSSYMGKALEETDKLYKETVQQPSVVYTPKKGDLERYSNNEKGRKAARTVMLAATGDHPGVQLGSLVKVILNEHHYSGQGSEEGEYLVTSITHTIKDTGEYSHAFEAIPSACEYIPAEVARPVAENQLATVVNNNDPGGMGRVKVQMLWQEKNRESTEWIHVMMPDAGGTGEVSTNRGHVFLPEVGDQVLVGFRYNDPNQPFVMGSVFNGKNGTGGGQDNNIKSIKTKSGHTIELNDTPDKESISIKDKSGNEIKYDTSKKSLFISSSENIELMAKNIKITAEENIELISKKKMELACEKDINILAKQGLALQSAKNTTIKSKSGGITIEASKDAVMAGQNVTVEGKVKATINGAQTKVVGKMTAIQGNSGKIEIV